MDDAPEEPSALWLGLEVAAWTAALAALDLALQGGIAWAAFGPVGAGIRLRRVTKRARPATLGLAAAMATLLIGAPLAAAVAWVSTRPSADVLAAWHGAGPDAGTPVLLRLLVTTVLPGVYTVCLGGLGLGRLLPDGAVR